MLFRSRSPTGRIAHPQMVAAPGEVMGLTLLLGLASDIRAFSSATKFSFGAIRLPAKCRCTTGLGVQVKTKHLSVKTFLFSF